MAGYINRRKIEHDAAMSLAWHTAYLHRCDAKKFPSLEKLLGRDERPLMPTTQSNDDLLAMMRQWAAIQNASVAATQAGAA